MRDEYRPGPNSQFFGHSRAPRFRQDFRILTTCCVRSHLEIPPHSGLEVVPGTGDGPGTGPGGTGRWAGPGSGDGPPGFGRVSSPRLIRKVDPEYTSGAMRAKLQGTVFLEAVVQADGTVGDVRVIRSLDSTFGLDQNAIKAVRQWRFEPGSQAGKPVPVIVSIELTFTLR
jgi:protein TonB